ncbi:unnamed protein product [Calypogeia fissa]
MTMAESQPLSLAIFWMMMPNFHPLHSSIYLIFQGDDNGEHAAPAFLHLPDLQECLESFQLPPQPGTFAHWQQQVEGFSNGNEGCKVGDLESILYTLQPDPTRIEHEVTMEVLEGRMQLLDLEE